MMCRKVEKGHETVPSHLGRVPGVVNQHLDRATTTQSIPQFAEGSLAVYLDFRRSPVMRTFDCELTSDAVALREVRSG